jgi:transcriptional regulator with XRE-family HTH domain
MTAQDEIYSGREPTAIGARLKLTREVLGLKQGEFGKRAGLQPNTYNMIEKGQNYPSLAALFALCDQYNLDMNWILLGDPSNLRFQLADALHKAHQVRERYTEN